MLLKERDVREKGVCMLGWLGFTVPLLGWWLPEVVVFEAEKEK